MDVLFELHLPPIHSLLHAGSLLRYLDEQMVRGIALTPAQGLARGAVVKDTGGTLQAPVGKEILSRMFDVFGNTIDHQPAPGISHWRTVHQALLLRRSTKSELFETGITYYLPG